ncbi:MAG: hypothetical protein K2X66_17525 [Cyanobacteria bacterium]|nr:hypothetical protein [Cyanobacteriota bacterium]
MTGNAGSIGPTPQTVKIVAKAKEFVKQTPGFSSTIQGPPSLKDLNAYNDLLKEYSNSFSSGSKETIPYTADLKFPFVPTPKAP